MPISCLQNLGMALLALQVCSQVCLLYGVHGANGVQVEQSGDGKRSDQRGPHQHVATRRQTHSFLIASLVLSFVA